MRSGFIVPHRQLRPFDASEVKEVALRAESRGFADVWVTEHTMDIAFSLDAIALLSYAAAVTERVAFGLSMAIVNCHSLVRLAHQALSLDQLSCGRLILAIALGRSAHFQDSMVLGNRAVRRYVDLVGTLRALTAPQRRPLEYDGEVFQIGHGPDGIAEHGMMAIGPYRPGRLPQWMGGVGGGAIRRAAALADGWMGNGGQSPASLASRVVLLREQLARLDRDPTPSRHPSESSSPSARRRPMRGQSCRTGSPRCTGDRNSLTKAGAYGGRSGQCGRPVAATAGGRGEPPVAQPRDPVRRAPEQLASAPDLAAADTA